MSSKVAGYGFPTVQCLFNISTTATAILMSLGLYYTYVCEYLFFARLLMLIVDHFCLQKIRLQDRINVSLGFVYVCGNLLWIVFVSKRLGMHDRINVSVGLYICLSKTILVPNVLRESFCYKVCLLGMIFITRFIF